MKKILVFYGSYGGGHLSAARSIKEYIETNYTNVEVKLVDCMEYIFLTFQLFCSCQSPTNLIIS